MLKVKQVDFTEEKDTSVGAFLIREKEVRSRTRKAKRIIAQGKKVEKGELRD